MNKKAEIKIIGTGTGPKQLTLQAQEEIKTSQLIIGAKRMVEEFSDLNIPSHMSYKPEEILDIVTKEVENHRNAHANSMKISLLVSGEPGFYSAAKKLIETFEAPQYEDQFQVEVIPAISSMNHFFSKIKKPWQDAALISAHGRANNCIDQIRRNELSFLLCGSGNSGSSSTDIAKQLVDYEFKDLTIHVGENLGQKDEKISQLTPEELSKIETASLTVLIIENPHFDASLRIGLEDSLFERGDVPMTKAEIRAVILSKLGLKPHDICMDIGCGTGSVSVEMALLAHKGHVYCIDKNPEAIQLTNLNAKRFKVGNITTSLGDAREIEFPPHVDVAFLGGGGKGLETIIEKLYQLNPNIKLVVSAIALESMQRAIHAIKDANVCQIYSSNARKIANLHMMYANNPIFIISN